LSRFRTVPDVTVTRRRNALLLHRRFLEQAVAAGLPAKGLDQAFAQKIEVSPSMWSQIKSARPIGDTLARQIERHCSVDLGWLDLESLEPQAPDPAEERFVLAARQAWRAAKASGKRELSRWLRDAAGKPPPPR
jgi:hypothetical protein